MEGNLTMAAAAPRTASGDHHEVRGSPRFGGVVVSFFLARRQHMAHLWKLLYAGVTPCRCQELDLSRRLELCETCYVFPQ